jgi:hypothetical protein
MGLSNLRVDQKARARAVTGILNASLKRLQFGAMAFCFCDAPSDLPPASHCPTQSHPCLISLRSGRPELSLGEMLVFLSNISSLFCALSKCTSPALCAHRTEMFCCEFCSAHQCFTLGENPAAMTFLIEMNTYCPGITWIPSTTASPEGTR